MRASQEKMSLSLKLHLSFIAPERLHKIVPMRPELAAASANREWFVRALGLRILSHNTRMVSPEWPKFDTVSHCTNLKSNAEAMPAGSKTWVAFDSIRDMSA